MAESGSLVLLIFAGTTIALLALGFAVAGGNRRLRSRLERQVLRVRGGAHTLVHGPSLRRDQHGGPWERLARRFLPKPETLRQRLQRTGRPITLAQYATVMVAVGAAAALLVRLMFGMPLAVSVVAGVAGGFALPHILVGRVIARRQAKFLAAFPEAIDLIVRGLRSGLPVSQTIAGIEDELPGPIGEEFRFASEAVRFGQTLEVAVWEMARRMALPEVNFFAVSLGVQRETGGNLGETLSNLGDILRRRRHMRLKVKAMSSEARASAMIIGSLPFLMFVAIMLVNPDYASALFEDSRGIMMLGVGLTSMGIGALVMAKMVRFKI
ncbi:MAG: type II secretion system F family protein [Alphaproteobacteria bacterium]